MILRTENNKIENAVAVVFGLNGFIYCNWWLQSEKPLPIHKAVGWFRAKYNNNRWKTWWLNFTRAQAHNGPASEQRTTQNNNNNFHFIFNHCNAHVLGVLGIGYIEHFVQYFGCYLRIGESSFPNRQQTLQWKTEKPWWFLGDCMQKIMRMKNFSKESKKKLNRFF